MKTDQLIDSLAADQHRQPLQPQRGLLYALPLGIIIAMAVFAYILDMRRDLMDAFESWRYLLKLAMGVLIAVIGTAGLLRLARPEQNARKFLWLLPLLALPLAAGLVAESLMLPVADWGRAAMGEGPFYCLLYVPTISLAPLAATLWIIGRGAPQSPPAAGAVAGLAAGGMGAVIYAVHCNNDSPFYVAIWYMGAIAIVAFLGSLIGRRYLRW